MNSKGSRYEVHIINITRIRIRIIVTLFIKYKGGMK